ncbi:MAG: hypothetical protein G01um101444_40 [Parcubacteria group bacterium Gr01-1014_44]|nr:MAG: hypothetical protein G01um101444_40 [Parcubacteria group bacterium Gr01-1014_44]
MKKVAIFLSLIFMVFLLQSCGLAKPYDIKKVALANSKYLVKITADINLHLDPTIYIWAEEVIYEQNEKRVHIKNGWLANEEYAHGASFFLKEVTFQIVFPVSLTIEELATRQKVEIINK